MSQTERYLLLAIGVALMVVGIILFYKMKGQGNNRVKLFGIEAELSAPSLVIFIIGSVFVFFPFIFTPPNPLVNTQVQNDLPSLGGQNDGIATPMKFNQVSTLLEQNGLNLGQPSNQTYNASSAPVLAPVQQVLNPPLIPPEELFGTESNLSFSDQAAFELAQQEVKNDLFWDELTEQLYQNNYSDTFVESIEALYYGMEPSVFANLPTQIMSTQLSSQMNSSYGTNVFQTRNEDIARMQHIARTLITNRSY